MMRQEKVLTILKNNKQKFASHYGVTRLGIFGSLARNSTTNNSDVDIVVEMPADLFKMVHMKEELESLLAMSVDLIRYQKNLDALLKQRIDQDAIYV